MRRRRIPVRWLVIGGGGFIAAAAIGLSFVPNLEANQAAAPPGALNRIARANDAAAAEGAARLRDRARVSVEQRDAQEHGREGAGADPRRADAGPGNSL